MKIKANVVDNKIQYTLKDQPIGISDLLKNISSNYFKYKVIIFKLVILGLILIAIPFSDAMSEMSWTGYFVIIIIAALILALIKSLATAKIKYYFPEKFAYQDLIKKFEELKNCSWTSGFDDLLVSNGAKDQINFVPNVIAYNKKKENIVESLTFFLPDCLCFNKITGNKFINRHHYESVKYEDITIEYADTISVDFVGLITRKRLNLSDTVKLADTYLHTNKDGTPDQRRGANNPPIPIFEAGDIYFRFNNPFTEKIDSIGCHVSNRSKGREFVEFAASTLQCKSEIHSRDDWKGQHFMAYILIFIASGADLSPNKDEKLTLIKALCKIFELSDKHANSVYDEAYKYYRSIRTNTASVMGLDTRNIISREYFILLGALKKGKKETLETVYQVAYDIANADNEIDDVEQAFLDAMKKEWGV